MKKFKIKLIRDVTPEEFPFLDEPIKKGETVYLYLGPTFLCCNDAYTLIPNETPFFELPHSLVEEIKLD
jgi:hypothetical protein